MAPTATLPAPRPDAPPAAAWLRRADESPAAYRAFRFFRALGAARSLRGAYHAHLRAAGHTGPLPRCLCGCWVRWRARFDWDARALAFDHWAENRRLNRLED